jgi:K+-sensing histidine kinase KdpD
MISFRDLTEQHKFEQIQNQNTYLNSLTANVSHEMMVPLSCIILFAVHLGITCQGDVESAKKAEMIEKSATILKLNVRDLLDRSLISKGRFEPNLENLGILPLV